MIEDTNFEALLAEQETFLAPPDRSLRKGSRVRGSIIAMDDEQLFIDLGGKTEAIMDRAMLAVSDEASSLTVGDMIDAVVTDIDHSSGVIVLGNRQGQQITNQTELEQAFRNHTPVEGEVVGVIKGGLEIRVAGQRAFCPASQIDIRFVDDLTTFVGQRFSFHIVKLTAGRHQNIVLSRRVLLEEEQQLRAIETRAHLKEGAVLNGQVVALKEFGAFVDLGGLEGLIHVSELAYGHITHPSEVLTVGQTIEVMVLRVEAPVAPQRTEKIALSLRALATDPWLTVQQHYTPGTQWQGKISRVESFGVFVMLPSGIEGLLHMSELAASHGQRHGIPDSLKQIGQTITVQILSVDLQRRRIALGFVAQSDHGEHHSIAPRLPSSDVPRSKQETSIGTFGELLRHQLEKKAH
jgi:small subunit ribosomal protein S1